MRINNNPSIIGVVFVVYQEQMFLFNYILH